MNELKSYLRLCQFYQKINKINNLHYIRLFTTKSNIYQTCYILLGVSESSTQDTVREAYINLVKKVHPDSGHPEASAEKFTQIDKAFRILQAKFAKERRNIEDDPEIKILDIKHTAPQHRQYLTYYGVGKGVPTKREKEYYRAKIEKAFDQVNESTVANLSVISSDKSVTTKSGTFYHDKAKKMKEGYDRSVEDLIQQAIARGEFKNLPGSGKPLPQEHRHNPYVDYIQHKFNKILLDNDFAPDWIIQQKQIRSDIKVLKTYLFEQRSELGPIPLSQCELMEWQSVLDKSKDQVDSINKQIDNYNLIVPLLNNQMHHVRLSKIAEKVLEMGSCQPINRQEMNVKNTIRSQSSDNEPKGILSFFSTLF